MAQPKHSKSPWVKTPTPNLIRYSPAGTYYLRARFGGGPVRESLETDDYATAKLRLSVRMEALRQTPAKRSNAAPETLAEVLTILAEQVRSDPSLKAATRRCYLEQLGALVPPRRTAVPTTSLRKLDSAEMQTWWKRVAGLSSPQRANHLLMWVKQAVKVARKLGAPHRESTQDLKRVKIPRTRLSLLTGEQFRAVLDSVRSQRRHHSEESANWMEFMSYCGLRPTEVWSLRWEHLDEKAGIITVQGGVEGTKNRKDRRVPMAPAMVALIRRMKGGSPKKGPVWTIKSPRWALRSACKRLGLPHQRVYDLRHAFATACAQSGVDVPTFAKWLGHSDGGTLAMRTYVHPDEEHGLRAVKKVRF